VGGGIAAIFLILAGLYVIAGIKIIKEFERGVVLRLGKYSGVKGPGVVWIIPGLDKMYEVDLRVAARDVPPQDVITRDNVSVKVNAVLYFRVVAPEKAILNVDNYLYATSQYAQTTLRSILGQHDLDSLLSDREKINQSLQEVIDRHIDVWGIKVTSVELKHVDLPTEMQRAMAKQAEAERERRAKVIAAEGEYQASAKLAEAAHVIAAAPGAMTLRYLQTLAEIAVENNSVTVFPVPIDLMQGLQALAQKMIGPSASVPGHSLAPLPAPIASTPPPATPGSNRPSAPPAAVLGTGPSSGLGGGGAHPFPPRRPSVPPEPLGELVAVRPASPLPGPLPGADHDGREPEKH
jgi:regulator of protease activity HflC (stomatin/prohibitin superfamily)